MFLLYLGKHQLHEYSAAVLQSLRLLALDGLQHVSGDGAGGELRLVPWHWGHLATNKVLSVHHNWHDELLLYVLHQWDHQPALTETYLKLNQNQKSYFWLLENLGRSSSDFYCGNLIWNQFVLTCNFSIALNVRCLLDCKYDDVWVRIVVRYCLVSLYWVTS